jgi:hypothetical protein
LVDGRFGAHRGLKSDDAARPKSANLAGGNKRDEVAREHLLALELRHREGERDINSPLPVRRASDKATTTNSESNQRKL